MLLTAGDVITKSMLVMLIDEFKILSVVIQFCTALINTRNAGVLGLILSSDMAVLSRRSVIDCNWSGLMTVRF